MTKREKIIVGIMAAAVVGGGLHFMTDATNIPPPAEEDRPALAVVVTQAQAAVQQSRPSAHEQYVLDLATMPWPQDPFNEHPLSGPDDADDNAPLPLYTGYIHVGSRAIAIIDGQDYREAEVINGSRFRVSSIHEDRVEIIQPGSPDRVVMIQLANEE